MIQNNMKNKKQTKQKGFTIVETLVSIFILLIAITGPLTFAQSGLRASFLARDQIVAFYLAQDVIETIKHLRDNHALSGDSGTWLFRLGDCANSYGTNTTKCSLDTSGLNVISDTCLLDRCNPLEFDTNLKKFGYSKNSASKYTRTIYVTELVQNQEAEIVVLVEWESNFFATRRIVIQENIFNWVEGAVNSANN